MIKYDAMSSLDSKCKVLHTDSAGTNIFSKTDWTTGTACRIVIGNDGSIYEFKRVNNIDTESRQLFGTM